MVATEQVLLLEEHVDEVMAFVREAGWNQVPADWKVMLASGHAVQLRKREGGAVASALALPYDGGFGWIGMVLVQAASRRRGHATRLLEYCIGWLRDRSLVPVLDATPEGAPVYRRLGFDGGERLKRWQGHGTAAVPGARAAESGIRDALPGERARIISIDREVFGADRSTLLGDFMDRTGSSTLVNDDGTGFVILRQGDQATQIGPLTAADEAGAAALLTSALHRTDGRVFLDTFTRREAFHTSLSAAGFEPRRDFLRMSLGAMPDFDGGGRAMVIAGPEYG